MPAPKEDLLERIQLRLDESSDGIAERVTDLPAADLVDLVNQLTRAEAPHRSRYSTSPVAAPVTWVARTLIDYTMAASRALIESAFTKTPFLQEVPGDGEAGRAPLGDVIVRSRGLSFVTNPPPMDA